MNDKDDNIDPRELVSGDASDVNTSGPVQLSCTLVLEILPEAVGGDLDEETLAIVARHIADCHACAKEWVSLRKAYQSLQVLRETASQMPGLDDAFFAELHVDIIGEIRHQALKVHDARRIQAMRQLGATVPVVAPRSSWRVAAILPKLVAFAATLLLGIFLGSMNGAADKGSLDPGMRNATEDIMLIGESELYSDYMRRVREIVNEFDKLRQKRKEASNPKTLKAPPAGGGDDR